MERSLRIVHASPVTTGGACCVERWWRVACLLLVGLFAGCGSSAPTEGSRALATPCLIADGVSPQATGVGLAPTIR